MADTSVTPNPWMYESGDFVGRVIRITVDWNAATRAITGATVFRDPACLYTKVYIGLGADGTPDSTPRTFTVPDGTTALTAQRFRQVGLNTIDDVTALQITAGP